MKLYICQSILLIVLFAVTPGYMWRRRRSTPSKTTTPRHSTTIPATTEAPTTEAPTTEAPTTEAPTTEAPTTSGNTTSHTTAVPKPDNAPTNNTYIFSNGSSIPCLKVQMTAYFSYNETIINVTKSAEADNNGSTCESLRVIIADDEYFQLNFSKTDKNYYQLSSIELNVNSTDEPAMNSSVNWGKTYLQDSYVCDKGFNSTLGPYATIYATHVQFQAFGMHTHNFGTAEDCSPDLSPVIPIVVGAVLAFLVLIVIIAYLIGRRRSRSGYEEI